MAKRTNELQDIVRQIEDLIADLVDPEGSKGAELPIRAEQNPSEAQGVLLTQGRGPPQG